MSMNRSRCLMIAIGLGLTAVMVVATPASTTYCADRGIDRSSTQDISEVQAILEHAGYLESGDYQKGENDAPTRLALRTFQSDHGHAPTGTVDYETMTQLLSHAGAVDSDGDGVADNRDLCPDTRPRTWVDE